MDNFMSKLYNENFNIDTVAKFYIEDNYGKHKNKNKTRKTFYIDVDISKSFIEEIEKISELELKVSYN